LHSHCAVFAQGELLLLEVSSQVSHRVLSGASHGVTMTSSQDVHFAKSAAAELGHWLK